MEEVNIDYSPQLVEAVILWTGWGRAVMPRCDDSFVIQHIGIEKANKFLPIIKFLRDDFYLSDASDVARNLQEMSELSIEDFKQKHPGIPDKIAEAFAWCYTFSFK